MRKSRFLTQTSLRRRNSESLRKCEFLRVCNSRGKLIEECVPIMLSKCWERHARLLRRATPFGLPNWHALHSHREMFQTYRYGKTQLGYPYSHTLWRGGWCLVPAMWLCSPFWRWYGCGGNEDIPSRRLIAKFWESKLYSKILVRLTRWKIVGTLYWWFTKQIRVTTCIIVGTL